MKNRFYHMKDIMEKFMISRDIIKYYEKKGLICPVRGENGYRMYSEEDVQRIRFILNIKDLGFSLEDVETQISTKGIDFILGEVAKIREETENQIIELNNRLQRISSYEQWILENKMYNNSFKVDYDIRFCIGCKETEEKNKNSFFVRDLKIVYLSEEKTVDRIEEKTIVLNREAVKLCSECAECSKKNIHVFPKVYRGTWCKTENGDIDEYISNVYSKGSALGYDLGREIYLIKKITKRTEKCEMLYEIYIPFVE